MDSDTKAALALGAIAAALLGLGIYMVSTPQYEPLTSTYACDIDVEVY